MVDLRIRHRTTYRYRQPVELGPHRLMLHPREARDLRLRSIDITVTPDANVTWANDVAGNAVATVTFATRLTTLMIESAAYVKLSAAAYPIFNIAASAISFPFRYSDDEWTDLGALTVRQYTDGACLKNWAQGFVAGYPTDTLSLLRDINAGVGAGVTSTLPCLLASFAASDRRPRRRCAASASRPASISLLRYKRGELRVGNRAVTTG